MLGSVRLERLGNPLILVGDAPFDMNILDKRRCCIWNTISPPHAYSETYTFPIVRRYRDIHFENGVANVRCHVADRAGLYWLAVRLG